MQALPNPPNHIANARPNGKSSNGNANAGTSLLAAVRYTECGSDGQTNRFEYDWVVLTGHLSYLPEPLEYPGPGGGKPDYLCNLGVVTESWSSASGSI